MPVVSRSLAETLRQILQALQVPFLFPATALVFGSLLLWGQDLAINDTSTLVVVFTAIIMLSYLLYAMNIPVIRWMEGYPLRQGFLFQFLQARQLRHFNNLIKEIEGAEETLAWHRRASWQLKKLANPPESLRNKCAETEQAAALYRHARLKEELSLRFPSQEQKVLPTGLGNTIAAFEEYPLTRYGIDSVHMWPRLTPILDRRKFSPFLQNEKSVLDFLLNSVVATAFLTFQVMIRAGMRGRTTFDVVLLCALIVAGALFYKGATVAARQWGALVRVAFDLYREDLRQALYLPRVPDGNLEFERKQWREISSFFVFNELDTLTGFVYSVQQPQSQEGARE